MSSMAGYSQQKAYQEPATEYQEHAIDAREEITAHLEGSGSLGGGSIGRGSMAGDSVAEGSGADSVGGGSVGRASADSGLIRKAAASLAAAGLGVGGLGTMKELGKNHVEDEGVGSGEFITTEREVHRELRLPDHLKAFKDSDEMLLRRYDHLCAVLSSLA